MPLTCPHTAIQVRRYCYKLRIGNQATRVVKSSKTVIGASYCIAQNFDELGLGKN